METIATEILVIGGGVGGTCAALQAARRGRSVVLVSEWGWLGGMLTSAGVSVPDGHELEAWQGGLWGEFLRSLAQQQSSGLHHSWVSFFSYNPAIGAAIFAQWVKALPNLTWLVGGAPLEILRQGDRILGARFAAYQIQAQITIDGTELGDCLALGDIPHRWGWEPQEHWQEPSAPPQQALDTDPFYQHYPIQSPTWVVVMQDFGAEVQAPTIPPPPTGIPPHFEQAWTNYGGETFLNYGRLPHDRFMINWPIFGNDYDQDCHRLRGSQGDRQAFGQEARWHSQAFAHFIQQRLGSRYGLALDVFPTDPQSLGGGAYGLHPYYREGRRLQGQVTVQERDLLPQTGGVVAPLPVNPQGQVTAIGMGNYVNDHHYTQRQWPLAPKALRWGGRWTGTPFSLPYGCLVPEAVTGFLACEKNIAVSHIANGATRLQPMVMALGQATGMAAALCVEQGCDPQDLPLRSLQTALLQDPYAPAVLVPLFDLLPWDPQWYAVQSYLLYHPEAYPLGGNWYDRPIPIPTSIRTSMPPFADPSLALERSGIFYRQEEQNYQFRANNPTGDPPLPDLVTLVTLNPSINEAFEDLESGTAITIVGYWNRSGQWWLVTEISRS